MSEPSEAWPVPTAHLRVARPSRDLLRAETFWTLGLGMQVIWRSPEHGLLMVGWPEATWHLELVDDPSNPPTPTEEDLLVLYLGNAVAAATVRRVVEAGGRTVRARNPYWDEWGVTFEDPDGYRIVLSSRNWTNTPSED